MKRYGLITALVTLLLAAAIAGAQQDSSRLDVIAGSGNAGPYLLSWAGIESGSETVSLAGQNLLRVLDYTIDYGAGKITFASPLRPGEMARVTYRPLPTGKPQNTGATIPFSMPMGSLLGADVKMNYLLQGGGNTDQSLILGMEAGRSGRLGEVSSSLLISQVQGAQAREATRAFGFKLAGKTTFHRGLVQASLLRAEEGFAGGQGLGLTAGAQVLNLAGQYQVNRAVKATTSFTRQDDVTGKTGNNNQAWSLATRYQPDRTLSAGVSFTRKEAEAGGLTSDTRTSVYDLALALPRWPSLSASRTSTLTMPEGGAASETITDRLALNALVGSVTTTASHQVVHSAGVANSTTSVNLGTPLIARLVSLKAAYSQSDGQTSARAASAALAITPGGGTQIEAVVGQDRRPGQEVDLAGVSATVKPVSQVSLAAGYKRRDYGTSALETTTASATFTPVPKVKVATEYAENPEDATGQPVHARQAKVGLSTQMGDLGLGGSYGQRVDATGLATRQGEVNLSLALGARQRLYSAYQTSDSLQPTLAVDTKTYRLGFSHNAGSTFSLSLEAQLLQYRENDLLLRGRSERRAEAKLNARF